LSFLWKALSEAILAVTKMNVDLTVEKIEIQTTEDDEEPPRA